MPGAEGTVATGGLTMVRVLGNQSVDFSGYVFLASTLDVCCSLGDRQSTGDGFVIQFAAEIIGNGRMI